MSADLYADLAWLPVAPPEFRKACRETSLLERPGPAFRSLASYALDEARLCQLASAIERSKAEGRDLSPLTPFRLAVVGNGTLSGLREPLIATAARFGIDLECIQPRYGQLIQEALQAHSDVNRTAPDAILIAVDYRGLALSSASLDSASAEDALHASFATVDAVRTGFRANCGALSIVQTLAPPPEALLGSLDRATAGTARHAITAFNNGLAERIKDSGDVLFDVCALAEMVGLAQWHSPTQWNIGKIPFDAKYVPLYADHVCRIIASILGKSRKCLVLDLDNTVWGGVIGDDGLEGIVIGQGDATGEAFLDVQRYALSLRDRGIVLAVSSKNTDQIARSAFREHPDMLLREDHIAVFQANWDDKATNIAAIAADLCLGVDSMVFLDDNPVERNLVRTALPQVAVPELPDDPALYARTLAAAGYFESIVFSPEDRSRAEYYQGNARRVALASSIADMDSYLQSLEMRITFSPFDATNRARITQLINKSNQFNLTTRRYTEAEVTQLETDPAVFTLQVRLRDSFGDNGMISVIVCRPAGERVWEIDTWLMSCRVLGRRVEQMVLREMLEHARGRGIGKMFGRYLPTEKNGLVRDHYQTLGFAQIAAFDSGETVWELDTATVVPAAPMAVERHGFEVMAG